MPLKWKIFRIGNYVHLLCLVIFIPLVIAAYSTSYEAEVIVVYWVAFITIAILMANSIINLVILEKYYPEKLPGKKLVISSKILLGFTLLLLLLMAISAGFAFYEEFIAGPVDEEDTYHVVKTLLLVYMLAIITGVYISWLQVALRKTIRRNFEMGIASFLNDDNP